MPATNSQTHDGIVRESVTKVSVGDGYFQCRQRAREDFVGRAGGGNRHQFVFAAVELDQRRGIALVDFQADFYRFRAIIFPLNQFAAALVANVLRAAGAA